MNNFFIVPLFAKIKFAKRIIAPEGCKNSMQLTSPFTARHNGCVVINVVGRQWNILTMWVRVQSPLFREIQQDTRRRQVRNSWWSLTRLDLMTANGVWVYAQFPMLVMRNAKLLSLAWMRWTYWEQIENLLFRLSLSILHEEIRS